MLAQYRTQWPSVESTFCVFWDTRWCYISYQVRINVVPSFNTLAQRSTNIGQQLCGYKPSKNDTLKHAGLSLAHRLRRWPNVKPTLFQCVVFAGNLVSLASSWAVNDENSATQTRLVLCPEIKEGQLKSGSPFIC